MKEAVFCSNMMLRMGFDESFDNLPLYTKYTSALHVDGKHAGQCPDWLYRGTAGADRTVHDGGRARGGSYE